MSDWYDTNYGFRRQLIIVPPVPQTIEIGFPITTMIENELWYSLNKLRTDDLDVRIVYLDPDIAATPVQIAIPHKIFYPESEEYINMAHVVFNAEEEIIFDVATPTMSMDYYIYYGNPNLINYDELEFIDSDFIIKLTSDDYNYSLTFSRPNEDWLNGSSEKINARFTLSFFGIYAMLNMMLGPDRGIMEVSLDDMEPVYVDTYNPIEKEATVYVTSHELIPDNHNIRCRVTGDKNPAAGSHTLEFVSFEYSIFVEAMQGQEEVNPANSAASIIIGV